MTSAVQGPRPRLPGVCGRSLVRTGWPGDRAQSGCSAAACCASVGRPQHSGSCKHSRQPHDHPQRGQQPTPPAGQRPWRVQPSARKRPSCPRAPSDGLSSPIGEVGSAERPVRHQPPPAAAAAVPLEAGSHPSQLRQAMSASKSPADVHLDVAPTPKAAAAAPPAPSPARPLWHSLPASSRALLVLGAGSALAAGVFAATQFSRVRHTKRCELQTLL